MNVEKVGGEVQHLAAFFHVDGENHGKWVLGLVPVDKDGMPVKLIADPDPRYPQGMKSFALATVGGKVAYHDHVHETEEGQEIHSYALYMQRWTMLDTARLKGADHYDGSVKMGKKVNF